MLSAIPNWTLTHNFVENERVCHNDCHDKTSGLRSRKSQRRGINSRAALTWREEKMMILRLKSCNTMLISLLILSYLTHIVQSYHHLVRSSTIISGRHTVGTVNNLFSRHSILLHHNNLYMAASGGRGGGSTKLDRKTCECNSLQLCACCALLCPIRTVNHHAYHHTCTINVLSSMIA